MALIGRIGRLLIDPRDGWPRLLARALVNPTAGAVVSRLLGRRLSARLLLACVRDKELIPGRPTVLCISRALFAKDIDELRKRTDINWITVSKDAYQQLQQTWVPWEMRQQVQHQQKQGGKFTVARRRTQELMERFLDGAVARWQIDAVMAPNVDYWQDDAMIAVCAGRGVPFLVLSRECAIMGASEIWLHALYRSSNFKYRGSGAALFNAVTRDCYVDSGAVPAERAWVTGAPRMDAWRDLPPPPVVDTVTLLSFAEERYLAPHVYREVVAMLGRVSAEASLAGLRFVLKCKNDFNVRLANEILNDIPGQRVEVSAIIPLFEVLPRSRMIIGYNSFAMIEALLTEAEIVIPFWDEARRGGDEQPFDPDDPVAAGAVTFAQSPEVLRDLLMRSGDGLPPPDMATRDALLQKKVHFPKHRTCSDEVADFVRHYVDPARHQPSLAAE